MTLHTREKKSKSNHHFVSYSEHRWAPMVVGDSIRPQTTASILQKFSSKLCMKQPGKHVSQLCKGATMSLIQKLYKSVQHAMMMELLQSNEIHTRQQHIRQVLFSDVDTMKPAILIHFRSTRIRPFIVHPCGNRHHNTIHRVNRELNHSINIRRQLKLLIETLGCVKEIGLPKNDTSFVLLGLTWISFFDPQSYPSPNKKFKSCTKRNTLTHRPLPETRVCSPEPVLSPVLAMPPCEEITLTTNSDVKSFDANISMCETLPEKNEDSQKKVFVSQPKLDYLPETFCPLSWQSLQQEYLPSDKSIETSLSDSDSNCARVDSSQLHAQAPSVFVDVMPSQRSCDIIHHSNQLPTATSPHSPQPLLPTAHTDIEFETQPHSPTLDQNRLNIFDHSPTINKDSPDGNRLIHPNRDVMEFDTQFSLTHMSEIIPLTSTQPHHIQSQSTSEAITSQHTDSTNNSCPFISVRLRRLFKAYPFVLYWASEETPHPLSLCGDTFVIHLNEQIHPGPISVIRRQICEDFEAVCPSLLVDFVADDSLTVHQHHRDHDYSSEQASFVLCVFPAQSAGVCLCMNSLSYDQLGEHLVKSFSINTSSASEQWQTARLILHQQYSLLGRYGSLSAQNALCFASLRALRDSISQLINDSSSHTQQMLLGCESIDD